MFDKLNLYKPIYYVLIAAGAIMAGWACAVDLHLGIGLALVWLATVIYALLESQRVSRNNRRYMQALRESLFGAQREAMLAFPMPTLEPRLAGFTITGYPKRSSTSAIQCSGSSVQSFP